MPEVLTEQSMGESSYPDELHPDVMAFLGAIDDLVDEYNATCDQRPDRRGDDEIMQMVSGIYDQASNYYSEDMVMAVSMLDMVTQRMMEHACRHDHLSSALEQRGLLDVPDRSGSDAVNEKQSQDAETASWLSVCEDFS